MALVDYKIQDFNNPVANMPDRPSEEGLTAEQIKGWFDSNANQLKDSLNGVIDEITPAIEEEAVFTATYNETTAEEIEAAYQAGKKIFCQGTRMLLTSCERTGEYEYAFYGIQTDPFSQKAVCWTVDREGWDWRDTAIARVSSPAFEGIPTAPTAASGTNTDQIATTAFVQAAQQIFIAQYGVTTEPEIAAKIAAGKKPVCWYPTPGVFLTAYVKRTNPSGYIFIGGYDNTIIAATVMGNQWSTRTEALAWEAHTHNEYALRSELAGKQDVLTFDGTPTQGSENPVTSGGVFGALSQLEGGKLFIAQYGETTANEIYEAFALEGRIPVATSGSAAYPAYHKIGTRHTFYTIRGTMSSPIFEILTCNGDNTWSKESTRLAVKESPTFTGTPSAPTAAPGTSTTQIATTEFVQNAIGGMHSMITDGDWTIRKQADGFFEAWYKNASVNLAMTQQSGACYHSETQTLSLPESITAGNTVTLITAHVDIAHAGYPVWSAKEPFVGADVQYYGVSGALRNATNYGITAYVCGRISANS